MARGMNTPIVVALVMLAFCNVNTSSGALVVRSGGAIVYDDDRNIMYLANANLAATEAFGLPATEIFGGGLKNWHTARQWIAAMNDATYLGYSDWRFPRSPYPDPTCSFQAGGQSYGYDCSGNELGHLYYDEIRAMRDAHISNGDPVEVAKFINLSVNAPYYLATESSDSGLAGYFYTRGGIKNHVPKSDNVYNFVWPVRDVVEPPTIALGLLALGLVLLPLASQSGFSAKRC